MKHGHFRAEKLFYDEEDEYPEMSEEMAMVHNYTEFLCCSGSKSTVNSS